jgi:hypothetical protein
MSPPNKRITADDEKLILNAYRSGKTGRQILSLLSDRFKTTKTVYDIIHKYGDSTRKSGRRFNVDHFYFSTIDKPEKAYILGLLLTDGWVRSDRPEIGLQLTIEDRGIIERVKEEWKSGRRLLVLKKNKFRGINGKIYQSSPMIRIAVTSVRMKEDLASYGVVPTKTRIVWMPLLKNYMSDLIRGIIDGDGTISYHGVTGQPCVRFVGSPYLMSQISLFLTMTLGVTYRNPSRVIGSDFLTYVDYSVKKDVDSIVKYAYNDPCIVIERKMKRAKGIISNIFG